MQDQHKIETEAVELFQVWEKGSGDPARNQSAIYERVLTTTVDNIEHIESTTVNGTAIVKIYLQPSASIDRANAQITAVSQTILRQLAPGSLPPLIDLLPFYLRGQKIKIKRLHPT